MKALVYEKPETLVVRDLADPVPGPGEALLRTLAVGICGSDVHGYLGKTGRRIPPLVMGHEVVAEVVALGPQAPSLPPPGASPVATGSRVAVNPLMVCGRCRFCLAGMDNLCVERRGLGMMRTPGAMSELFVAPVANLVPMPPGVAPATGSLAEPLAVGLHAVRVMQRLVERGTTPGQSSATSQVAVVRAGIIGLAILASLPGSAQEAAVILDVREDRLARVKALLPAVRVANPTTTSWEALRERLAPGGFDAVFEAVGISETARGSVLLARPGGAVVWVGNAEPVVRVPMQQVVTQELAVAGSYGFTAGEFRRSVEQLPQRPWVAGLVDRIIPLEQGPGVFAELARGDSPLLKVVLDPARSS